jgi:hypothetical protein
MIPADTPEPPAALPGVPTTRREWQERFPNLSSLLGAYFHQDALDSQEGILDYYVAHELEEDMTGVLREIPELRRLCTDEDQLDVAFGHLGAQLGPLRGQTYDQWLGRIDERIRRHLDDISYDPSNPPTAPAGIPTDPSQWSAMIDRAKWRTMDLGRASTYETDEDARRFAQRVIDDHRTEIIRWLEGNPADGSTRGFEMLDSGEVTGRSLSRGDDGAPRPVTGARVVLRAHPDAAGGYYILTTYPVG